MEYPVEVEWVCVPTIGPNTDWSEALCGATHVVHLAALAHQVGTKGKGRLEEFMNVNAIGTKRLVEAIASSASMTRLVFLSSIGAVTSMSAEVVRNETTCKPDSDYGLSKLEAEHSVCRILHGTRVDWTIIRPVLVYGSGNPGNMARLQKLIDTALPLPFAGIHNRRSFVYVGNLVDAIEKCLSNPGASRRIFFVSDDNDVSTPGLMKLIAKQSGRPLALFWAPVSLLRALGAIGSLIESVTDVSIGIDSYSISRLIGSLAVDSSEIRNSVGWIPPYTLEQGLTLTLHSIRQ
jgi:nucleoside-diphosphate-sugar epimerase